MTELIVNPDHDALGSFVLDDIPNGARVYLSTHRRIHCIWQDGKVVDASGNEINMKNIRKEPKKGGK